MFGKLGSSIRAASGVDELANLGTVYRGKFGQNDCTVLCSIDTFKSMFFLRLEVDLSSGKSFKNVQGITWPYSQTSALDLDAAIQDLQMLSNSVENGCLIDTRSAIGRFFDKITGQKHLGEYTFQSLLKEDHPRTVRAIVVGSDEGPTVTLVDKRKHSEGVYATLQLEAIPFVIAALQTWKQGGG